MTFHFHLIKLKPNSSSCLFSDGNTFSFHHWVGLVISVELFINRSKLCCVSDEIFKLHTSKLRQEQSFRLFFFPPFTLQLFGQVQFSSDFSPAVHLLSNLFIHLFEASLNSIWPQCPIIRLSLPRQSTSGPSRVRECGSEAEFTLGGGGGQFSQHDGVKRVIIVW